MRKEYLRYVEEYVDRLEPLMSRLEHENSVEILERREVTNYSFNREGVLFKLQVKSGGRNETGITNTEKDNGDSERGPE